MECSWTVKRIPLPEARIRTRLSQLSTRLGDADWLDGPFSAADLMMVSVLQRVGASSTLVSEFDNLAARQTHLLIRFTTKPLRDPSQVAVRELGGSDRTGLLPRFDGNAGIQHRGG